MKRLIFLLFILVPILGCSQGIHKNGVIIGETGDTIAQIEILNDTTVRMFINSDTFDLLDVNSIQYVGGGGGSSTFIGDTDTPGAYAGAGGYVVMVNGTPDALVFINPATYAVTNFQLETTLGGYTISDTKANFNTALSDGNFIFDSDTAGMLTPYALSSEAPAAHATSHELGGGDLVSHDDLLDFVADEHIDWTNASDELVTTDDINGDTIHYDGALVYNDGVPYETITAATGITAAMFAPSVRISGLGGVVDITANPQVDNGLYDGQVITFVGGTNAVTFDDGAGLQLNDRSCEVSLDRILELEWVEARSLWLEKFRSPTASDGLIIGDSSYTIEQVYVSGDDDEYLNLVVDGELWQIIRPFGVDPEDYGGDYFISPTGSDATGDGSYENPWFTLNQAWTAISAGDTLYCRGGTYSYSSTQSLTGVNGTSADTIKVFAYPGEQPVFTKQGTWGSADHIALIDFQGDYFHWRGIEIENFTQENTYIWYGMRIRNAEENIFEQFSIHDCGSGIVIRDDGVGDVVNNLILNGDFYYNKDPLTVPAYDNADGIEIKYTDVGDTNYIKGCRTWWNSDDGIDLWMAQGMVVIDSTWSWKNGFQPGTYTKSSLGIGFKLGQQTIGSSTDTTRRISNSIAWMNSEAGWSENSSVTRSELYNNIAYRNGQVGGTWGSGFEFFGSSIPHPIKNNIAYDNLDDYDIGNTTNTSHNDWNLGGVTITLADWVDTDTLKFDDPREADGSLPYGLTLWYPAAGSDILDVGTDVGLPYVGAQPDIGAKERQSVQWWIAILMLLLYIPNRKKFKWQR